MAQGTWVNLIGNSSNGHYRQNSYGPEVIGVAPAGNLDFRPVRRPIDIIGTNGTGPFIENDPTTPSQERQSFDPIIESQHVRAAELPADMKAAFKKWAAVAKINGGLDHTVAERVAWGR